MVIVYLCFTSCVTVFHYEPQEIKFQRPKICRYTYMMIVQYLNKLSNGWKREGVSISSLRHTDITARPLAPQRLK